MAVKKGRPNKDKELVRNKQVRIRMTEREFELLKENAKYSPYKTISDFIRGKCCFNYWEN